MFLCFEWCQLSINNSVSPYLAVSVNWLNILLPAVMASVGEPWLGRRCACANMRTSLTPRLPQGILKIAEKSTEVVLWEVREWLTTRTDIFFNFMRCLFSWCCKVLLFMRVIIQTKSQKVNNVFNPLSGRADKKPSYLVVVFST